MLMALFCLKCLCALAVLGSSHGSRILGIFPTPSISHQLPFQAVMKALASRGHEVTVISPNPLKNPHPNYTDIDVSFSYDLWDDMKDDWQQGEYSSPYRLVAEFPKMFGDQCDAQLSSPALQNFINSQLKFDLVFVEIILTSCMFGVVHHVGSPPVIGIMSFGGMAQAYQTMGSPFNPSVDPDAFWPYDGHMTFLERTNNLLFWIWTNVYVLPVMRWKADEVTRKFFGNEVPSAWESHANLSLFMLNSHWSLNYPRPLVPGIIDLGSLHLQNETKPLPMNLRNFLDGASKGFIYFSLGSNVRSERLPDSTRNEFLAAFAELPQKVLWKWEADSLPGQPENVMINKWLPQQDVLAHPNCLLFITQGGLQSLDEATHNAVPLVGIPFFGDQSYNVKKIVTSGIGVKLDIGDANKDTILKAIRTVLEDPRYRENMKRLSVLIKDQPETSLERAVWWSEYVLRHKGAGHLRYAALDLSWPQYLLLDVIAFLLVSLITVGVVSWLVIRQALRLLKKIMSSKIKTQ